MAEENQLISFTICGQTFRVRESAGDPQRIERVAAAVDNYIRERKTRGVNSDLRASIMTAYELAFELDEVLEENAKSTSDKKMEGLSTAMDRILQRLDQEIQGAKKTTQRTAAGKPQAPRKTKTK